MESTTEKILYDIFVPSEWEEPVTIEVGWMSVLVSYPDSFPLKAGVMGMSDTPFLFRVIHHLLKHCNQEIKIFDLWSVIVAEVLECLWFKGQNLC